MMTDSVKPKSAAGGARAGAGRKRGAGPVYELLAEERRRHEAAKALAREMSNRVRAGELLEKHDVEVAATRMHAAMAQFLRSLPDDLERKCGLPPSAVEALELAIDSATVELSGRIAAALTPATTTTRKATP